MKLSIVTIVFCLTSTFAAAQGLECKVFNGPVNVGSPSIASSTAIVDSQNGYRLTGGGCDGTPKADGEAYGSISSVPSGDTFKCTLTVNEPRGARVTAYATGCRVPRHNQGIVAKFTSEGLGGGLVTIARTSGDSPNYTATIPYSLRVCDTGGGEDLTVYSKKSTSVSTPLPFGQCFEVDQPNELIVATANSVSITATGQYELFPKGTFSGSRVTSKQSPPKKLKPYQYVKLGQEKSETVHCYLPTDSNRPPIPAPGLEGKSYIAYCPISDLANKKSFRVCFENGYSNQPSGALEYPGSLLPMVLDPVLLTKPIGDTPDETLYNSIAPGGCRDLFQVEQAYFVLVKTGPDPGNWLGQTVNDVTFSYREIMP